MIEPDHPNLSMGQQYALLSIPLPSFYHAPQGTTDQTSAWKAPILSKKREAPQ
jgi:putative transposase